MKKLMTLVAAAGALAGMQAVAASPAAAYGYCSPYYGYYYYAAAGCCPRYYEYRPVVVTYHRVVRYRPVAVRYYRPCCR